ncbi:hypothetical protein [Streptomyces sp. NPDC093707]
MSSRRSWLTRACGPLALLTILGLAPPAAATGGALVVALLTPL